MTLIYAREEPELRPQQRTSSRNRMLTWSLSACLFSACYLGQWSTVQATPGRAQAPCVAHAQKVAPGDLDVSTRTGRWHWQQMLERQKTAGNRTIPHILHHLWASGVMSPLCEVDNLTLQTHAPHDYMSSHEQTWQIMSWDLHAATAFVTDFYPWFLPVFLKYDNDIRQAEAVKPLILHKLGGVHLKSHSQCIRPADVFEQNTTDAILQVSTGMMASKPGLALWLDVMAVLKERAKWEDIYNGADVEFEEPDNREEHKFLVTPEERQLRASSIWQTGPLMLTEALRRNVEPPTFPDMASAGMFHWRGAIVRVVEELGSRSILCKPQVKQRLLPSLKSLSRAWLKSLWALIGNK